MDFQKLLLEAGSALSSDEVKALGFLCVDLLNRNPARLESPTELFSHLMKRDHLSEERPQLLTELLFIIQRHQLIRKLHLPDSTESLISHYRKLLYELYEDISNNDLKKIKFLLEKKLPSRRREEHVTSLEVFLELEHFNHLSQTNLSLLEDVFKSVCPVLNEKIRLYKEQHVPHSTIIAQEEGRPRSKTFPSEAHQFPLSIVKAPSVDKLVFVPAVVDNEVLAHKLQDLNIGTTSCDTNEVGGDALDALPAQDKKQNEASSETQTPQTANTKSDGLKSYPMTRPNRGICLIINNSDFTKSAESMSKREGTLKDARSLQHVFQWLSFGVKIVHDCERNTMLTVLQELGRMDHSQMDCLVCCILSHGKEGSVYGVDGNLVKISDVTAIFDGQRCPSLAGKPKMFFIQACQGSREQRSVHIQADSSAFDPVEPQAARECIPASADFLLGMSTVPSFVSYRDKTKGSWFIQLLCQNVIEMVPRDCDLLSILTKVNADVSQMTDKTGWKKQMPQPAFSLRKKVVFPVPSAPPPSLEH